MRLHHSQYGSTFPRYQLYKIFNGEVLSVNITQDDTMFSEFCTHLNEAPPLPMAVPFPGISYIKLFYGEVMLDGTTFSELAHPFE
jgi:hypothetical protein